MRPRNLFQIAAVLLLAAALLPSIAGACPLCADAKSNTDYPGGSASLPKGFYYSILFMVSAPFVVMGGLLLRIRHSRRRARGLPAPGTAAEVEPSAPSLVPDPRGAQP